MAAKYMRQLDKMGRVVIPKDIRDELDLKGNQLGVYEIGNNHGLKIVKEEQKEEAKTLDRYGRVVIPIELRQKLKWQEGKQVEIKIVNEEVIINDDLQGCAICEREQSLLQVKGKYVCEECLGILNTRIVDRWALVFHNLLGKYREYGRNALTFKDPEDIHQARVYGRRLKAMLLFINVSRNHPLLVPLKEAHKLLGNVRELDVFLSEFIERTKLDENNKSLSVYAQLQEVVADNRKKHKQKLENKLPEIISDHYYGLWEEFIKDELRQYVVPLSVEQRLSSKEQSFQKAVDEFEEAVRNSGRDSGESLDALHRVRIEAKYLRYVCRYLNQMFEDNYKKQADYYEGIQDQLGVINDLKDWLKIINKHQRRIDAKKKHIKSVKLNLKNELAGRVEEVNIMKIADKQP
ncbi:CHAD domain-containing protein [Halobacillus andaensis]|uniref:CHAD domain-containing protein n=1 Tax=Halobacillus andaensis TaxID=1176239 RepID=UPI003D765D00